MYSGRHALTRNPPPSTKSPEPRRVPTRLEPLSHSSNGSESLSIVFPNKKKGRGRFRSVGVVRFDATSEDDDDDSTIASTASTHRQFEGHSIISNMSFLHSRPTQTNKEQHRKNSHLSPLQIAQKSMSDFEADIAEHERQNRLPLARSDTHSIAVSTSFGSVAEDLRRSYIREVNDFGSFALFIESRYTEMINFEGAGDEPTRFKAAAAVEMMFKICEHLGRYSAIMKPILWELCNCIFLDFRPVQNIIEQHPQTALKELVRTSTYFEHCAELVNRVEIMQVESDMINQGIQMKDVMKQYQTVRLAFKHTDLFIRDACFYLWKVHMVRKRRARRVAMARGLRYRMRRWREYVSGRTAIHKEVLRTQLDHKIHRLMRLNENMLNLSNVEDTSITTDSDTQHSQPFHESENAMLIVDQLLQDDHLGDKTFSGKPPLPPSYAPLVSLTVVTDAMPQITAPAALSQSLPLAFNQPPSTGTEQANLSKEHLTPSIMMSMGMTPSQNAITPSMMNCTSLSSSSSGWKGLDENGKPNELPNVLQQGTSPSSLLLGSPSVSRTQSVASVRSPMYRRQFRPVVVDASTQTIEANRMRIEKDRRRSSLVGLDAHNGSETPSGIVYDTIDDEDDSEEDEEDEEDEDDDRHTAIEKSVESADGTSTKRTAPSLSTSAPLSNAPARRKHHHGQHHHHHHHHKHHHNHHRSHRDSRNTKTEHAKDAGKNQIDDSDLDDDDDDMFDESEDEVEQEWSNHTVTLSPREHIPFTVETTCELIGYIYEQLFIEHQRHQAEHRRALKRIAVQAQHQMKSKRRARKNSILADPSVFHEKSILEVARKALLSRYHNIKISLRIFKDLLRSCLAYCKINQRVEVFAKLCNMVSNATEDIYTIPYVPDQCVQFFFFILEVLTEDKPEEILNIIVSQRVERDVILKKLPKIFPNIEKEDTEFRMIVDKIIDMKIVVDDYRSTSMIPEFVIATHPSVEVDKTTTMTSKPAPSKQLPSSSRSMHRPIMVNFDDAMDLLLGYQELELQIMHDSAENGRLIPVRRSKSTMILTDPNPCTSEKSFKGASSGKKDGKQSKDQLSYQAHLAANRIFEDSNES